MSDDEPDITITTTTEIDFGDFDPEDAYDAEDAEDERLDVLEAVVEHLREHRDERFEGRRQEGLRVVGDLLAEKIEDRIQERADEIRGALEEMA